MTGPSERLVTTIRAIDTVSDWCGKGVAWTIVPLFLGLTFEVVSRYGFDAPTEWAYDVTYMLYGTHFMLGAAYTLLMGGHIRTDMFYDKYSPRTKGLVDAVGYLIFFFPAVVFLLVAGGDAALVSWRMLEKSEISAWRPPIYPFKAMVPLAALLLLVQGVSEFLKSVYAVKANRLYAHREEILI